MIEGIGQNIQKAYRTMMVLAVLGGVFIGSFATFGVMSERKKAAQKEADREAEEQQKIKEAEQRGYERGKKEKNEN